MTLNNQEPFLKNRPQNLSKDWMISENIVKDSIALKEQNQASIFGCPKRLLEYGTDQVQQDIDNAEHIFQFLMC